MRQRFVAVGLRKNNWHRILGCVWELLEQAQQIDLVDVERDKYF